MSDYDDNYSNSSDEDDNQIGKMTSKMFLKTSNNLSQFESENNDLKKEIFNFKIILLGDIAVGKTSILSRFCTNTYSSDYKCSIGVEFKVKSLNVDQSTIADLKIWDTCGDERYRAVTRQYYKESKGVILVFDLTNKESFKKLDFWIEDVTPFCKSIAGQICLLQFLPFVNQHTMTVTTEVRNNLVFILS